MAPLLAILAVAGPYALVLGVVALVIFLASRAVTEKHNLLLQWPNANQGVYLQHVACTWTGTNATDTVKVKFTKVFGVHITAKAAQNTDEDFYWADTLQTDGTFKVPNTGVITIGRTGTKTSGLAVTVWVIGQ